MKVSDVQHGDFSTLELKTTDDAGFGKAIQILNEVGLFYSEMSDASLLKIENDSWEVAGVDDHNQDRLERLTLRNLPRIAWVAATIPKKIQNPKQILIEVREFPSENIWPGDSDFGVDEKIVDTIRNKRKSLASINDVVSWLTEKTLIPTSGGSNLILLSGSPTPQTGNHRGFRIYGKGIAVDIVLNSDNRSAVTRVVEARRPTTNDERRPVLLIRGQFRFIDYTIAGLFRGTARSQLDQLVEDANSYLSLWREYNKLERQSILSRAREFGWLRYNKCRPLPDGRWRFTLVEAVDIEPNIRTLEDNESVNLEAAERPPIELIEGSSNEENNTDRIQGNRVFAGECVGFDRNRGTVDLRQPMGRNEDDIPPPDMGVLFVSLTGDRKRLERREKAQALIASAECPMPQLGLLIEGKVVPERRRKHEKPMSVSAKEAFGGEPTGRQIEALKVALNTPDIALIQGPPGTGKTRTIAALQTRLSEIAKNTDNIAGRHLLTSYQHDAVENVASATQVFGLPAVKVGRKRGQTIDTDGFEHWRLDRIEAVSAQLAGVQETPAAIALQMCRDLAVGYLRAPSRSEDVSRLLRDVREYALPHIPPDLTDKLMELRQKLESKNLIQDDNQERELALKAVRGIRIDKIAFSDDGSIQALKALRRLDKLNILTAAEHSLLERASDWAGQEVPEFLDDLRIFQEGIIDRLLPDERPANAPRTNVDVEILLSSVIDALRERVHSTKGGAESVLYEYRSDLEMDQQGAREAVSQYTVVLAATCQQAVGYQMSMQKNDDIVFETVVVDEAARANPLDLFIPMSLAERRIILVGDHRQLPHILEHEIESDLDKNATEKTEEMLRNSLFERLFKAMQEREQSDGIKRTVTLDVQYRMHPVLGNFISDTFYKPYGESFQAGRGKNDFYHNLQRYEGAVAAWVDIPLGRGRESGQHSKKRPVEAKWIAAEVHRILLERSDFSVGVITFYSAQVGELLQQMEGLGLTEQLEDGSFQILEAWRDTRDKTGKIREQLRVGTVDAFQGKEFDVVFLSMTRSNDSGTKDIKSLRSKYGHLMLENRLCVAMSRQQRLLIVVGDSGMLKPNVAEDAIRGLKRFHELCGGEYGVKLHG